jgi:hypothetical protein
MAVQIGLRRGTQAQWSAANPVLESGEIVVETDTNQVKIGDGSSNYNSLPYGFEEGLPAESFNALF